MTALRSVVIAALGFLAVSGIVGAVPLIWNPTGEPWAMPQRLLQYSPFHSYLVPGIILLVGNGLFTLIVLWLTVCEHVGYGRWVVAQGCVLMGWLIVETVMLRLVIWPHYLYGSLAFVLVLAGAFLSVSRTRTLGERSPAVSAD